MKSIYINQDPSKSQRHLICKIHDIFNIVRQLISDNLVLLQQIDKSYEQILLDELKLIPEQYDDTILTTIRIIQTFIKHISFVSIAKDLSDIADDSIRFDINTFSIFQNTFDRVNIPRKDKSRIMNIVTKFKPLFSCIDVMLSKPINLVHKIGTLQTNSYSNIFD